MDKNDIYLGVASKQNVFLPKIGPKKRTHAFYVLNRPWFNIFWVFNTFDTYLRN